MIIICSPIMNCNSVCSHKHLQGCVFLCVCVWSPCLHLFQCAGFIVSEHLFNKGLEGFEMNLVPLSFSAPCLILVWKLKMEIRESCATLKGCVGTISELYAFHLTSWLIYLWLNLTSNYSDSKGDVSIYLINLSFGDKILSCFLHILVVLYSTWSKWPLWQWCHLEMKTSH